MKTVRQQSKCKGRAADLEDLLGKTRPNLFLRPATDAAFLQRMTEARATITQLTPLAKGACLAIIGQEHPLTTASFREIGTSLIVGRSGKCDWVVGDTQRRLSASHFRVARTRAGYCLTDLESTNGTWLNENSRRVGTTTLQHGDVIAAGGYRFVFCYHAGQ